MKQLIIGVLLLVGTISSMASDFTITPAFQQHLTFYNAGNQTLSVNYQFKIHNNMRDPLYLNNKKVIYTSGGFKATLNPAGTTCSFYMEKFNETTPVLPNEDCIIAYTYTLKKSVFLNGKAKSFISTLSVLGQLGLTVNYTATIKTNAYNFTVTPAFQHLSFNDVGNQTISFDYQFKIHNNMRYPLYLTNKKVVYTSDGFKATLNPAGTTCSFFMEKLKKTAPVLPNKDCIIAYTYTLKKSVYFNGKAKSFISTLSVLDELGLTVNYTATIKLKAFSRDTHKHVLLVGLGGTLGDAFKIAVKTISTDDKNYHFINEMIKGGKQDYLIYAGGNSDRPETKQTTLSGPGWATILTGVWADKHGINSNTDIEKNYHKKDIPTVFNDIKDAIPTAYTVSLAEWKDISTFANFKVKGQDDAASVAKDPDKDKNLDVTTKAIEELKRNSTPTFMFLHYDAVDKEGQATGYDTSNTAYMNAVNTVLGNANKVLEEVQNLRDSGQQWLVIFTTDHGGKGNESKGRSWQERQVFATYHDPKDKRYSGGGEINAFQGQTNITPTILDYFDIPIPKNLYGKPINASDLPVRWLWGRFHVKPAYLDNDYPQLTSNAFPALGDNVKKINKAMRALSGENWNAYFFLNDGTYITYSTKNGNIISDPKPIKGNWRCLADPKIASAKMTGAVGDILNSIKSYFFSFDNGYCTLCNEGSGSHDTIDLSIYPEKLEKFSPALVKEIKTVSIKRNWAIISKELSVGAVDLLVPKEGIYLELDGFGPNMPDNNIKNHGFSNKTWPGIANYSIQTVLSNNQGSAEDKLTSDYHAFFLKPMKYN